MEKTSILPKVIFVGESQSGKTSLIRTIKGLPFESHLIPTISGTFATLSVSYEDGLSLPVTIAEVGGSEQYKPVIPMFARLATIGFITIPLNIQNNENNIDSYINILNKLSVPEIFLVGTKDDDSNKKFREQFRKLATNKKLRYFITSSKDFENDPKDLPRLVDEIGKVVRQITNLHHKAALNLVSSYNFRDRIKVYQQFIAPKDENPFIIDGYKDDKTAYDVESRSGLQMILDQRIPKTERVHHSVEREQQLQAAPSTERGHRHHDKKSTKTKRHH